MTENDSLKLPDKLALVALELLIQDQDEQPIKRIHIGNVAGVSPRIVTNSLKPLREQGIVSVRAFPFSVCRVPGTCLSA